MAKADFETYHFSESIPQAVIPKPNNDVYAGAFVPGTNLIDQVKLQGDVLEALPFSMQITQYAGKFVGFDYILKHAQRSRDGSPEQTTAAKNHTLLLVKPSLSDVESPLELQQVTMEGLLKLYRKYVRAQPVVDEELIREAFPPQRAARLLAILTPLHRANDPFYYLEDFKDTPCNAFFEFADVLPVRVYRWLPGPPRTSGNNREKPVLEPTYNPQPFNMVVAQSVRIELVNPFKALVNN